MKSFEPKLFGGPALLICAGAAFLLASCGSGSIPTATELTTLAPANSNLSMEDQVGVAIGEFRGSKGMSPQTRHSGLDKLARLHAQRMLAKGKMSHDDYHLRAGMAEKYYGLDALRENVAYGKGFAKSDMSRVMMQAWIDSGGHRRNLLADTTHYGVGIAVGEDGSFYSVQLSATPVPSAERSAYKKGMPLSYSNLYDTGQGPAW